MWIQNEGVRCSSVLRPFRINEIFPSNWLLVEQSCGSCLPNALILYGSTIFYEYSIGSGRVGTIHCGFCVIFEHTSNRKNDEFCAVLHSFIINQLLEIRCDEIAFRPHSQCKPSLHVCSMEVWTKRAINPYAFECMKPCWLSWL